MRPVMDIHGTLIIESTDISGETIKVSGAKIEPLIGAFLWDEHRVPVGQILAAKKLLTANDCASDTDRGLFDLAKGQPIIRIDATVDCSLVPGAAEAMIAALGALIQAKALYFGAIGRILRRENRIITASLIQNAMLTVKPVHAAQRVFAGRGT